MEKKIKVDKYTFTYVSTMQELDDNRSYLRHFINSRASINGRKGLYLVRAENGLKFSGPVLQKDKSNPYYTDTKTLQAKLYSSKTNRNNIVYIGRTISGRGLEHRVLEFVKFKDKKDQSNHQGGRITWQLKDTKRLHLYVCCVDDEQECLTAERQLIEKVCPPANVIR